MKIFLRIWKVYFPGSANDFPCRVVTVDGPFSSCMVVDFRVNASRWKLVSTLGIMEINFILISCVNSCFHTLSFANLFSSQITFCINYSVSSYFIEVVSVLLIQLSRQFCQFHNKSFVWKMHCVVKYIFHIMLLPRWIGIWNGEFRLSPLTHLRQSFLPNPQIQGGGWIPIWISWLHYNH